MKQGFEALQFNLDNKKSNKATPVLKQPPSTVSDENQRISYKSIENVKIPLQGVNYGLIGDLEEILDYLTNNNQSCFVADHDFMGQKMNISVHIMDAIDQLQIEKILDNREVVKQTKMLDNTIQNFVNIILNVVPKQYKMSNEGLSFDTKLEEISFGALAEDVKQRYNKSKTIDNEEIDSSISLGLESLIITSLKSKKIEVETDSSRKLVE